MSDAIRKLFRPRKYSDVSTTFCLNFMIEKLEDARAVPLQVESEGQERVTWLVTNALYFSFSPPSPLPPVTMMRMILWYQYRLRP
jgi:hypothetical protein